MKDHIVMVDATKLTSKDAMLWRCQRCGAFGGVALPVVLSKVVAAEKVFSKAHRGCKASAQGDTQ